MLPQGKCDMSEVDKMAYYDLKTNEIRADSNIAGFHDEHIEIDEVIAPLIRELNIKGYKTKFCCSGHPFYSLCEAMVDSEETAKAFVGLIGTERTENPRVPVRALYGAITGGKNRTDRRMRRGKESLLTLLCQDQFIHGQSHKTNKTDVKGRFRCISPCLEKNHRIYMTYISHNP